MDACSPAEEMVRSFSYGMRHPARTGRCYLDLQVLCTLWLGVRMGVYSPVAASMDAFGCGRYRGHNPPSVCRRSQGIPTGCWDWLLRPTVHSWPAGAWTGRSSFGTWPADACARRLRGTQTGCGRWPGAPMGAPWPVAALMERYGSGRSSEPTLARRCMGTPPLCMQSPSD